MVDVKGKSREGREGVRGGGCSSEESRGRGEKCPKEEQSIGAGVFGSPEERKRAPPSELLYLDVTYN